MSIESPENQSLIESTSAQDKEHLRDYLRNFDLKALKEAGEVPKKNFSSNEVEEILKYAPELSDEELDWAVEEYESLILPRKADESTIDLDQVRLAALYQELDKRENIESSIESKDTVEKIRENMWLLRKPGSNNPTSVVFRQKDSLYITDPGTSRLSRGKNKNFSMIDRGLGAELKGILLTHSHPDHIGNISNIGGDNIPVYAHRKAWWGLRSPAALAKIENIFAKRAAKKLNEPELEELPFPKWQQRIFPAYIKQVYGIKKNLRRFDKEENKGGYLEFPKEPTQFDGYSVEVVEMPGHSPGEVSFWIPEDKILVTGDIINNTHLGRDHIASVYLPESNIYQVINSLEKIRGLSPKLLVPAHGEPIRGEIEIRERIDRMISVLMEIIKEVNAFREREPRATFKEIAKQVFSGPEFPQRSLRFGWLEKKSIVQSVVRDAPKNK